MQPVKDEAKNVLPKPFAHVDVSSDDSDSKIEDEELVESDLNVENEDQTDPYPNIAHSLNPRSKWAKKFIKYIGNIVGDPSDQRRTRSQYQDENIALCHIDPLLPKRCYMMVGHDT